MQLEAVELTSSDTTDTFNIYHGDYRKVNGEWLISSCSLHFLWPRRDLSEGFTAELPG